MTEESLKQFKAGQRESWGLFAPLEMLTTIPAGKLIKFAYLSRGEKVLDVACGTGVVAISAARFGAKVSGLDLSPVLLERAKWNAATAVTEIDFQEGDVEQLPYAESSFDVVLSQYGHMFAPRPEVAIGEMLRVLKPGGRIAFSTWPPELFVAQMFSLTSKYFPPPPGIPSSGLWGDPNVVRERLGSRVTDLVFSRDEMSYPALSPQHYGTVMEKTAGPVVKLVEKLKDDPQKLAQFRTEMASLVSLYLDGNELRQHFLMTRAIKKSS